MPEYYFDIETAPLERFKGDEKASFDPSKAKIISIQYQHLDTMTGMPRGELHILKEWEAGQSEGAIIQQFKKIFIDDGFWQFIPIGNNLVFDYRFMKYKLKQYCNVDGLKLGNRPMIDLKHVLVIANNGSFKGYDKLLQKSDLAANISSWYYTKDWPSIEKYITNEALNFLRAYSILKREIPKITLV